jgi:3-O-alpha-D-mannopyranosyl-alpha-D-mannopyranose xylosylphosphotransferase
MALVTASGPLGLSAFFPPKDALYSNAALTKDKVYPKYIPPPHLPLTATWHEADFSLEGVMSSTAMPEEQVNLREYTMKLLSRYMYLSGEFKPNFSAENSQIRVALPHA